MFRVQESADLKKAQGFTYEQVRKASAETGIKCPDFKDETHAWKNTLIVALGALSFFGGALLACYGNAYPISQLGKTGTVLLMSGGGLAGSALSVYLYCHRANRKLSDRDAELMVSEKGDGNMLFKQMQPPIKDEVC